MHINLRYAYYYRHNTWIYGGGGGAPYVLSWIKTLKIRFKFACGGAVVTEDDNDDDGDRNIHWLAKKNRIVT